MALTGHLWVKRGDKDSGHKLIDGAVKYIKKGICFIFFPEGTRKIDPTKGPLGEFKAGAFKVRCPHARAPRCEHLPASAAVTAHGL